jgi:hypothetical protein
MKLGKSYEYAIYEGAGHGFLRQPSGREGANLLTHAKGLPPTIVFPRSRPGAKRS